MVLRAAGVARGDTEGFWEGPGGPSVTDKKG